MIQSNIKIPLRPGITNSRLWNPDRPSKAQWERIRKVVLERDEWTCTCCGHQARKWMNVHHLSDSGDHSPENLVPVCVACHAVLHVGLSLMNKVVEVWRCDISQVEVVQRTRDGVRQGLSLAEIKKRLPLSPGPYPANSVRYANDLVKKMGTKPRDYLDEPLCAMFVKLNRWQIEDQEPQPAAAQ